MIHIVIPVRNNLEVTLECLRLLSLQTWKDFDVTVTDDGSTDGTYEAIREQFPSVTVLRGDGNLWWTGAINTALEYILPKTADDDYILTLNDDVVFDENYLANLAEAARMRPGWLIGSVNLDKNDTDHVIDAGIYYDWRTRKRVKENYRQGRYFNDNVNRLPGRGAMIPVELFRKAGIYDASRLPHYGGDEEMSLRAQRFGFHLCVFCSAVLYNDTSHSGYKFTPLKKVSFIQASRLLFSNKSILQMRKRFNFIRLCCPQKYLFRNIFDDLLMTLQVVTSIPPLWHLKKIVYHIVKARR